MYIVTKTNGLLWKPENQVIAKSGWDEINMQLRYKCLINRTTILCNPNPNWFGNDYQDSTDAAILSAWNTLLELMQIEVLEKGYYAFVGPTNDQGIKFEIIGHKDIVNIVCSPTGDINWRIYRDTNSKTNSKAHYAEPDDCYMSEGEPILKISSSCERIAKGNIQASERGNHPEAGRQLRGFLLAQLLPYQPEIQTD